MSLAFAFICCLGAVYFAATEDSPWPAALCGVIALCFWGWWQVNRFWDSR